MNLSEKISMCRKKAGLSQEALGEKLNVSRQAVSKWETGDAEPESINLIVLAQTFGVTVDWLLNDEDTYNSIDIINEYDIPKTESKNKFHSFSKIKFKYLFYLFFMAFNFIFLACLSKDTGVFHFHYIYNYIEVYILINMIIFSFVFLYITGNLKYLCKAIVYMFIDKAYSLSDFKYSRRAVNVALIGSILGSLMYIILDIGKILSDLTDFNFFYAQITVTLLSSFFYIILFLCILLPINIILKQAENNADTY